jgi:hypothetical protein
VGEFFGLGSGIGSDWSGCVSYIYGVIGGRRSVCDLDGIGGDFGGESGEHWSSDSGCLAD